MDIILLCFHALYSGRMNYIVCFIPVFELIRYLVQQTIILGNFQSQHIIFLNIEPGILDYFGFQLNLTIWFQVGCVIRNRIHISVSSKRENHESMTLHPYCSRFQISESKKYGITISFPPQDFSHPNAYCAGCSGAGYSMVSENVNFLGVNSFTIKLPLKL